MKLRSALLVGTVLVAPIAAKAQPVTGFYVGAGAGFNYLMPTDVNRITPFTPTGVNLSPSNGPSSYKNPQLLSKGGYVGVLSGGFGFGNGLRVELEGDFRKNHYKLRHAGALSGGGDIQTYGPMVNVLYDFNFGFPVVPYLGLGAGYQFSSMEHGANVYTTSGIPGSLTFNKTTFGSVAGQFIAGVAYNIPGVPGLALTGEYRFLATVQNEKFKGPVTIAGLPAGTGTEKIGNQYDHAALFGIRYNFGVGAPPAMIAPIPAAAVTPARSYLVFFDWDRADLTARARQIIAEAASNSTKVQYTKIQVAGHADKSGTAQYNQRLSLRRAENVASELVKDGVPRTAIDIQAFGDTRPLVPTAAGVREPQNRRVEIVLQ